MSLKYAVVKSGPNCYVLPKCGPMKVEVRAFLSEVLYNASEEELWRQAYNTASYEGVVGAYLMPDTHSGFGSPIGSVTVTEGTLIQSGSGYDISCGIMALRVPGVTVDCVRDRGRRERWVQEVEKRVAMGVGKNSGVDYSSDKIDKVLRYGAKALGIRSDLCERQYIQIPEDFDLGEVERAYQKARPQLGTLGGGNHFIELQVATDGSVWVMIHTGSRGYGWQIAEHFFYKGAELRGLPKNRRGDSWLTLNEPLGKQYWAYHNTAANFAIANRHVIASGVQEALQEVFGFPGEVFYDISHNLIQEETLVLPDGSMKKGLVHRKGATRAFPAKHPDLKNSLWYDSGHPVLIPGSMYDGAAILFPSEGAYKTACSMNHGSGRVMARGAAKRQLGSLQDHVDSEMSEVSRSFNQVTVEGIVSNNPHIPLDECRHVYKSLDAVLGVLTEEGIASVAHRMFPVANIKAAD